jgi:hypothetical protein
MVDGVPVAGKPFAHGVAEQRFVLDDQDAHLFVPFAARAPANLTLP